MTRLSVVAPDLATALSEASLDGCRRVAIAAASFALSESGLDDPDLLAQVARLKAGEPPVAEAVQRLDDLVERLDEAAWDLQDQMDAGKVDLTAYLQAFGRARAAAAVAFAFGADARLAALEAVYEASVIVDDPAPLWRLTGREIEAKGP